MEDIVADLLHQIDIKASPQQVYAAFATSSGLASWWTTDAHAELKIGGKAEFGFNKRGVIYRMTINGIVHERDDDGRGAAVHSSIEVSSPEPTPRGVGSCNHVDSVRPMMERIGAQRQHLPTLAAGARRGRLTPIALPS